MSRKEMLCDILSIRRRTTTIYQKYLSTPREYYPGEKLLMREVHIITTIGLDGLDNVSELAGKLGITNGAVSQYLAKLEKKGFLRRIQDEQDKRQYSVVLTDKGKELYRLHTEYDRKGYAEAAEMFDSFTEEELEIVRRFDRQFEAFTEEMNRRQ
ncbi:MAG: MarR family transcriptional regulator [Lachnospiraceae bacterium]|nr:MarR family transcriptional regulator [Lachnospiraceae bacterium]